MNTRYLFLVLALTVVGCNSAWGQFDFFWSFNGLNSGATNSNACKDSFSGEKCSLFLYYTTNGPADSDIDTGFFLDITTSKGGTIVFTASEVFEADVDGDDRWASVSPGTLSADFQMIDEMSGFALPGLAGVGVADATTGLDDLYDAGADAFLLGRIDFLVLGAGSIGIVNLLTSAGDGGIVHDGQTIDAVIGSVEINVLLTSVQGDVNCDGAINLDDIAPFVELISTGGFSCKADINQDGVVNLLDVAPFVALLTGG